MIINPISNNNNESENQKIQLKNYISLNFNQLPNNTIINVPMILKCFLLLMPTVCRPLYIQYNITSLSFNHNPSTSAVQIQKTLEKK